jgi:glycosyltransferase involved in cell wall biosynthesis
MKIGVDARPLAQGSCGGVSEYTRQIFKALLAQYPDVHLKLFFNAATLELKREPWMQSSRVSLVETHLPNRFVFNPATRFLGLPKVNRILGPIDVFFSPQPDLIGLDIQVPQVITVHDLAFCFFPELFERWRRRAEKVQRLKYQLQRADRIIAVSESTRADLIDYFKLNPQKIRVIPLGLDPIFQSFGQSQLEPLGSARKLPRDFILFLGVLEARKNVLALVEGFNLFKAQSISVLRNTDTKKVKLILAGPAGFGIKKVIRAVKDSPFRRDIRFTGSVSREQSLALFRKARVFAFPSHYEGFGLPPLEAASQGVPVIVSYTSSLPEVLGTSAVFINPNCPQEIARALEQVLGDSKLRDSLVRAGKERIRQFSWQKAAQQTYQVLANIARVRFHCADKFLDGSCGCGHDGPSGADSALGGRTQGIDSNCYCKHRMRR